MSRKTPSRKASRPTTQATENRGPTFASSYNPTTIRPAQIHQKRVETSQLVNQNKILRSHLIRIKDVANSKATQINNTVSNTEGKGQKFTYKNSNPQLEGSVQSAENTLASLKEQYKQMSIDDKIAIVEELEEQLKIFYVEYQRVLIEIQLTENDKDEAEQKLAVATEKTQNARQVSNQIRLIRAENEEIKGKYNAYQEKFLKLEIDTKLKNRPKTSNHQSNLAKIREHYDELNLEIKDVNEHITEQKNEYQKNVNEIEEIIDGMKEKIASHLLLLEGAHMAEFSDDEGE